MHRDAVRDGQCISEERIQRPVGLVGVHGRVVIFARVHILRQQRPGQPVAAQAEGVLVHQHRKILVRGAVAGPDGLECQPRHSPQAVAELVRHPVARLGAPLQHLQALQAQDGVELGHPGVQAGEQAAIVAIVPILARATDVLRQRIVVRGHHAALARHQQLGGGRRKGLGVAVAPQRPALEERAKAMGGVKNQSQTMTAGDRLQRIDVGRVAEIVHGDDAGGARGDGRLDAGRVQAPGIVLDVRKDRRGPEPDQGVDGGHEGEAGNDHLTLEPQPLVGEGQAQGATADADGVPDAQVPGQLLFESPAVLALGQHAGGHDLFHLRRQRIVAGQGGFDDGQLFGEQRPVAQCRRVIHHATPP